MVMRNKIPNKLTIYQLPVLYVQPHQKKIYQNLLIQKLYFHAHTSPALLP